MAKRRLGIREQIPAAMNKAVPIEPVDGLLPPPPVEVTAKLAEQQVLNLRWCEEWGASMPMVEGIPLAQSLTYDLIQILNRALVGG